MRQLNYQALSTPVSQHDKHTTKWGKHARVALWIAGALVILGILFLLTQQVPGGAVALTLCIAAISGLIAAIGYQQAARQVRLQRFAQQNNLAYRPKMPYDGRPGIFFGTGHSKFFTEALLFNDTNQLEIGNYQYTTGSGKNRQTHSIGYARITLPRRLPHMVLDARKNNLFGRISNIPTGFSASQRLSLEGDFDAHFTLYAPPEYKRDALYVFTPDVMQAFIASAAAYDCEIIDDTFYLYAPLSIALDKQASLEPLLHILEALNTELVDQTDYYADERVGDRTQNIVAAPGARLKTRFSTSAIIITVIAIIWIIMQLAVQIAIGFANQ